VVKGKSSRSIPFPARRARGVTVWKLRISAPPVRDKAKTPWADRISLVA
jgi:hypothetical protein